MTQLQKIVAKAKILKKSYPNTKWTDLIKKASKLVTPSKKAVVKKAVAKKYAPVKPLAKKKIAVKKSVGYKDDRIEQLRKATPYIRKYKEKGFDRKEAIKNAMLDAGYLRGTKTHKDTKSHNVNIRVVSGVSKSHKLKLLNIIDERLKSINQLEQNIEYVKDLMTRFDPYRTKSDILKMRKEIKEYKDYISLFKYDIRVMKKHIK